jgi:glycosyltransferase involved in cell wall biosynthesis
MQRLTPEPRLDFRVLVVIPAYCEEKSIGTVVRSIRGLFPYDILVIDDGSPDGTGEAARKAGAIVLELPCNLGIGGAVQTSFMYALAHGYDAIVRLDGDGQHEAAYIEHLLAPLRNGTADAVIGSRFLEETAYRASFFRMLGISYFRILVNLFTGYKITDPTSGFFAINRQLVQFYSAQYPSDYPEVDSYILMHRLKARVAEIPVRMYDREEGKSSITPIRAIYYMVKVTLSFLINRIGRIE